MARPFRDIAGWVRDVNRARDERDKAVAENAILRQRNAQLTQQNADAEALREQLKFTKSSTNFGLAGYRYVAADVIGRPLDLFNSRITIAAGTADGVHRNDAVVAGPGWLVGHIGQVGARASEVILINDPASQVSAGVPAENAAGQVKPSSGNRNVLILDYVSKARARQDRRRRHDLGVQRLARRAALDLSARAHDRQRDELRRDRHRPLPRDPGHARCRPAELLDRHRAREPADRNGS